MVKSAPGVPWAPKSEKNVEKNMILLNQPGEKYGFAEKGGKDYLWAKRTSNSESLQKIIMTDKKISSWHALGGEIKKIDSKNM